MNTLGFITGSNGFLAQNVIKVLEKYCKKIYLIDLAYNEDEAEEGALHKKKLDITSEKNVDTFFQNIDFQSFDKGILVNMAAIDHKVTKHGADFKWNIEESDVEKLRKSIEVSLIGTFIISKYFCTKSVENNIESNILNFASDLSFLISNDSVYGENNHKPIDYSISKHGLIGLTKYFAVYYAKNNIRVNSISPSGVENDQNEDFVEKYSMLAPIGRMITSEEIEGAVEFLVTDKSSFITGQNIILDGGKSLW